MVDMEYSDYLNTDWWKSISAKRKEYDKGKCIDCGSSMQLNAHHINYDRLGRENLDDLITLCESCHHTRHLQEESAKERRYAARRLTSSPFLARKQIYTLGFVGFAMGEAAKRSLNPRNWDDLKLLRTEYCELMEIPENDVGLAQVQAYSSALIHEYIDSSIKDGKSVQSIASDLSVNKNLVYKRIKKLKELGACMKKLDLSNVEAMEPNERERIEAGGYVVRIIDIDDHEDREFLWMVFDIAEGVHKDFYTKDANKEYYADKPNKHGILFSYKSTLSDAAKRMLKGKLKLFTDSNPGFDAESAWNACKPEMFIGRTIGIVAGCEEYVYEGRDDGQWHKGESIDWFHAKLKKPDDIRSGKFTVPDLIQLNDDDKAKLALAEGGASISAGDIYDDIPFN